MNPFSGKYINMYFPAFVVAVAALLSSCEKVINPNLQTEAPAIVIEGAITDKFENQIVKISRTVPFDNENEFNGVNEARVTVRTDNGGEYKFSAVGNGRYRSFRFSGTPGVTYHLEVETEGQIFRASSTMPFPVNPDSIIFKKLSIFGDSHIYPSVYYKDPPQVQNQYRYVVSVNGKLETEQVISDRFSDGNPTSDLIMFDEGVASGDEVDIEVQSVDWNVFKYYFAIAQIRGDGGPPVAPANPESNIDNGALGIFSAYTTSTYSLTLK